ncbi:C45 family autoproteolytic acyltransferase/hydolase [Agarivorans aestuarii]|uniref:C45 family autoproteolytic acyltransferase/hydolase n=1 Tax=Agarivorans aestuarii TaxID=1563703 RepID=UPI001C8073B2|nr:C45 family autoproteolytic acyltransferase/hydolase [Agarivorans aestuarii]
MKKSILTVVTLALLSTHALADMKAGDKLDYYQPQRAAHQNGAELIDLSGQSAEALAQTLAKFDRLTPDAEVLTLAKNAVANNQAIAPKYAAMMERQAEIRGVEVHELYAAALQMDWSVNKSIMQASTKQTLSDAATKMRGCTTLAFADTGIVAQNNDLGIDHLLNYPTRVIKTDDTIFIPTDGSHFQGMGKHVGVVLNIMGEPSGTTADINTKNIVTIDAVFAAITSSTSVEDAFNKLKHYTTPVAMNFTVADDSGDHGAIEMSVDATVLVRGDGGIGHANHNAKMKQTMLETMSMTEANETFVDSFAREQAAQNFVDFSKEKTVQGMKYILKQKPINITLYDKDFVTVESMIFDTKQGCAYVSGDNPLFSEYTKVCF